MTGLIDVSSLTPAAKSEEGLLPQPANPLFRTALVGIYVDALPMGGSDKCTNGLRFDSIGLANGMITQGVSCQLVNYVHSEHDKFMSVIEQFDGIVIRINPGQITASGGSQKRFDDAMMEVAAKKPGRVWPTPDVMAKMGAKDALCQIKDMDFGLPDTLGYYAPGDISEGFRKTIAFQPRVVKQNRGSAGEGIWIIKLKNGNYCENYCDRECADDEVLVLKEANDNHVEEHTVAEFIEFCVNGRTDKSGTWESKGKGQYFEGGKDAGGQMVDQRYLPRIDEGEARFMMVGKELYRIEHYVYVGGVGGETKTTIYPPDAPEFAAIKAKLEVEVPHIMKALDLKVSSLPLLWAADFIPVDKHKTDMVVGEFNCSCLGIAGYLNARGLDLNSISAEDKQLGQKMCDFIGSKALEALLDGPVDVSSLTKMHKSNEGLLPQPREPLYRIALIGVYVPSLDMGGSDKCTNGHRFDSIGIANGMIKQGVSCQLLSYVPAEHDEFFAVIEQFDGIIIRCNPGQINAAGGDQNRFDESMMEVSRRKPGRCWPTPEVMGNMGAKDALCQIKHMDFGLQDTLGYYDPADIKSGFKKTIAFQPRVVKQNRGSSGEGIWIIKLKAENYCANYGDRECADDEVLVLKEANDNHVEEHTVAEFIEFCVNGRTEKSGTWASKGVGSYFEGGKEAGGQMVDQRFLPRIDEGEARFMMVGRELYRVEHYVYIGGVGGETKTTIYGPEAPEFAAIKTKLETEVPLYMKALGLPPSALPLLWAADFIPVDNHASPMVIGEFNCSCLGIAGYLNARGKELTSISKEDAELGQKMCDFIGEKAFAALQEGPVDISSLSKVTKNNDGLLPQPRDPLFKTALIGIYVDSLPMGGSDKVTSGHRFDSIGMANGMIKQGVSCQLVNYIPEEHAEFFKVLEQFDGIIIRINPGQITAAGGFQTKFDDDMMEIARKKPGCVWPTPDVMSKMGAKDALCQIKTMDFGLPDTLGYYSPEDIKSGFRKTIAFQPRVVKQNRGSAGEGIWIIKLKSENYCSNYCDREAADDEVLVLKEANDNHTEEHTVAEFIEFCVNGRCDKSGDWTSKGEGRYFLGGKEAGGQMVDQRFLPRIEEGEARFMMVGTELYRIEHYVYIGGVGGETKTTIYGPDAPEFAAIKTKLEAEVPAIMKSLGLSLSSLPLLWATDFIPVDNHASPMVIGEFNCSCLGIAGYLNARGKDLSSISKEDAELGQKMCDFIGSKALAALQNGPIDISTLSKVTKNDGLLPQPKNAAFTTALVGIYVPSLPMGGSDKVTTGHRFDSIGMANGMIKQGVSCQVVNYLPEEHDEFFKVIARFDGIVIRINPGQISAAGGNQKKFDDAMMEVAKTKPGRVWPTPDVMAKMGAKDALCQIKDMDMGLPDTLGYYEPADISAGFRKTIAFQPRVVKQNRGSAGEGIWIIKLKSEQYCENYGDKQCADDDVLVLKEANDNHVEEHTVAEFIEFCVNGRTDKSGTWTSKGTGKYFEGGKAEGGQMVDQRYLPRIDEGEARFMMIGTELYRIEHYVYVGGVGGETKTTIYPPHAPEFASIRAKLEADVPAIMKALGLSMSSLPLLWAADFIPVDKHASPMVIGEFNCSCLGIAGYLNARGGDLKDLSWEDTAMGQRMCDFIGSKARQALESGPVDVSTLPKVVKNNDGLLPQPKEPKFKTALVGIYVPSLPMGGSDKLTSGHRFDSIGIANGIIKQGVSCQLINYVHTEHDEFFKVLEQFDGIIMRCNPGQIAASGGSQKKFDDSMMAVAKKKPGCVWPTPDVMAKMGAKDALCQIKDMDMGLPDTLGYYEPADIDVGFKKTIAFQPRVVKQNRGSSGEGIWIVNLKSGDYCANYGDRSASDDEVLVLKEANDSHVEEHTVKEFIEFCVNGRTDKSGTWTSLGTGKYFEGGKEAGGQMVDQRFLPRIEEGEARFMMIGTELYRIEHYVYIGGVGGETKTTIYPPNAPEFAEIKAKLEADTPAIMKSLGLPVSDLPLLWAADFIPVDKHKSPMVIGEFNCSCLGIAGYLNARGKDLSILSYADTKMGQKMCDLIGVKAFEALKASKNS